MVSFDEIRQLQEELEKAQSAAAAAKLSRRNCVQVVMKLQEAGLLDLFFTLDGKEYVTPSHLKKEITDEILVHNGRMEISNLQELLNVDMAYINKLLQEVMEEDDSLHLVDRELVNEQALDNIAVEVNQILQDTGRLELPEQCKRFQLPIDFLMPRLQERVGTCIKGELVDGGHAVITGAFKTRQKHRICGYFSGVTRPVTLTAAARQLAVRQQSLQQALSALTSSKRLCGSVSSVGGNAIFLPAIHTQAQERWIDNFYRSNGYLEYAKVSKLGIAKAGEYTKKRFPDATPLHSCVVANHTIETLNATVEEMLFGDDPEPFTDVTPLLPPPCSEDDVQAVLSRCPVIRSRSDVHVLAGTMAVTDAFIDKCRETIESLMPERLKAVDLKAVKAALEREAAGTTGTTNDSDDEALSSKAKRRNRRKKGGNSGGKGKQKKGSVSSEQSSADVMHFMTVDEMAEFLSKEFPDVEDHPGFAEAIAATVSDQVTSTFKEKVVAQLKSGVSGASRKEARNKLETAFSTMYDSIRAFAKTAQDVGEKEDEALGSELERHLLRTLCLDLVGVMVKLLALENLTQFDIDTPLSTEDRKEILNASAPEDKKAFNNLVQLCNGKAFGSFQKDAEKMAEERLHLFIRPLDKKREKGVLANHRAAVRQMLQSMPDNADTGAALLAAVTLLFAQERGQCVHAHGRSLPQLIDLLKADVGEETHATLKTAQDEVYAQLTRKEEEPAPEITVSIADLRKFAAN